jgi:hypothetical protein
MFDVRLITTVLEWERRLEIEEEKRKSSRFEDVFTDFPAAPQPPREERKSIFDRIFRVGKDRQPVNPCGCQDPCPEV